MSLRLHPEYGVNPALGVCFWCGEDSGEVLLLGYNRGREAPRKAVANYEPCAKCKESMEKGIFLVEVVDPRYSENPPMAPGASPTGRWSVVTRDWVESSIKPEELKAQILEKGKAFVPKEDYEQLIPGADGKEVPDDRV